jgi:hypothetical protein
MHSNSFNQAFFGNFPHHALALALMGASIVTAIFWVALTTGAQQPAGEISPLQTVLRGQTQWLSGGPASLRVIATNHNTGAPADGNVKISIVRPADKTGRIALFNGVLHEGTVEARFNVPLLATGTYEMQVHVESPLGIDTLKQNVEQGMLNFEVPA